MSRMEGVRCRRCVFGGRCKCWVILMFLLILSLTLLTQAPLGSISNHLFAVSVKDSRMESPFKQNFLDSDGVDVENGSNGYTELKDGDRSGILETNPAGNESSVPTGATRYNATYREVFRNGTTEYANDCHRFSNRSTLLPAETLRGNGCQRVLPQALIVGMKKCGTMTLSKYLGLHPAIGITPEVQIPHGANNRSMFLQELRTWREQLKFVSPDQLQMGEMPAYITRSLEEIAVLKPFLDQDVKFINMICDPVVRAVSDYVQLCTAARRIYHQVPGPEHPVIHRGSALFDTFERTVSDSTDIGINVSTRIITNGIYVSDIRRFLKIYKREQLLILDGNAFAQDPFPTMKALEKFLQLHPFFRREHFVRNPTTGFFCANVTEIPYLKCANPNIKGRPHPRVEDALWLRLYQFYKPYNHVLQENFHLNFSWLLK